MVLSRTGIGTILLQLVEQEAGQGLKEDKSPEVVRGPSPLKDFFFLTIMTLRSSQVTIIISTPASAPVICSTYYLITISILSSSGPDPVQVHSWSIPDLF